MKGVVFNILEKFVEKNFGEDAWDDLLENDNLSTDVFVGPSTYDDSDFLELVTGVIKKFELVPSDAIFAFGKFTFPYLVEKVPELVSEFKTSKDLLMGLDSIIHIEVRKLLPGAETPRFNCTEKSENVLMVEYTSKRNLPDFARGLITGLGEYYKEDIYIETVSNEADTHVFKVAFNEGIRKKDSAA